MPTVGNSNQEVQSLAEGQLLWSDSIHILKHIHTHTHTNPFFKVISVATSLVRESDAWFWKRDLREVSHQSDISN